MKKHRYHPARLALGLLLLWLLSEGGAQASRTTPVGDGLVYLSVIQRACAPAELIQDSSFEGGTPNSVWQVSSNVFSDILDDTPDPAAHSGMWKAWLGGSNLIQESLWQALAIPAGTPGLRVSYWWRVDTFESAHPFDTLAVQVRDAGGTPLETLETLTDGDASSLWRQSVFTLTTPYAGQTIQLAFVAQTDDTNPTSFFVDDVSVARVCPTGPAADFTGDCRVTVVDIQETAALWQETRGSACYAAPYDLDGDGSITAADITQVAAQWHSP